MKREVDREVVVTIVAKQRDARFDEVFDLLGDRYASKGNRAVSAVDNIISVSCWPWWTPGAVARHQVAKALSYRGVMVSCEWVVKEWAIEDRPPPDESPPYP